MKNENKQLICGLDEAGRGPLAGPVCAAAVILGNNFKEDYPDVFNALNDSKKIKPLMREKLRLQIIESSLAWGIGWASHEEIDEINILQASLLAMKRAFEEMLPKLACPLCDIQAIADGTFVPELPCQCKPMVKADAQIPEVMAASILAKTARDKHMEEMAELYPQYGYEIHKGYGTPAHRKAILEHGPSPIQRKSFKLRVASSG